MPLTGSKYSLGRGSLTLIVGALVALVLLSLSVRVAAPEETERPGIHHILVEVSDLKASIAFYRDVAATVDLARKAGHEIVQEPRRYTWGTEAFVADPDGYIWAIVD